MAIEDNSHVQGFVAIDGNDSQKHPLDIDPEYVMGYPRSSGSSVTLAERLDTLVSMGGTQTITGEKTFTTPISGTISVAEKLQTARNLGVALDGSAAAPFDGSANQLSIPVSGTLPIANGGTGATAVADIQAGKDGAGNTITSTYATKADVAEEMATKADIDGNYPDMTVGNAEQLLSDDYVADTAPYTFRTAGGNVDIGDREYDELVGGTIAWNQLVYDNASWNKNRCSVTATGNAHEYIATCTANTYRDWAFYRTNLMPQGHKYIVSFDYTAQIVNSASLYWKYSTTTGRTIPAGGTSSWQHFDGIYTAEAPSGAQATIAVYYSSADAVTVGDTLTFKNLVLHDLTAMFGTTIADYISALETATPGAGVAWFRTLFPKDYYSYNAGTLQSVQAASHDMVGFNAYDNTTGTATLLSGNQYQITGTYTALAYSTGETITPDSNGLFTPSANGTLTVTGGNATDTCVHLVWSGYRNGEYEPYEKHSYPLDSTLTLRGIPKLDASNNLYYDGDTYEADGTVTRRYGIVDLGSINYLKDGTSSCFVFQKTAAYKGANPRNIICSKYPVNPTYISSWTSIPDKTINANDSYWIFCDADYASSTKEQFKTAMSGVYLVYELTTPTTETADPFQSPQIVSDFGTEQYVDAAVAAGTRDVAIPVGHDTRYTQNLRDKLRRLPNMPDAEGDYLVRYANRMSSLVHFMEALPAAASDNTPEDLGEASAGTSDYYSRADHVHRLPSQIATNTAHIEQVEGKADKANKNIENIRALMNGVMYQDDVDATSAYVKSVPSGAMQWASMDTVGGKTFVWSQHSGNTSAAWKAIRGSVSVQDGIATYSVTAVDGTVAGNRLEVQPPISSPIGHKFFVTADVKPSEQRSIFLYVSAVPSTSGMSGAYVDIASTDVVTNDWNHIEGIVTTKDTSSAGNVVFKVMYSYVGNVGATMQVKNAMCINLTALYGAGNEPTIDEFKAVFPADYYAYSAPTLLSMGVTDVVSKDSSAVTVGTISIPAEVKALTGYGWSARNVYNYIDFENKKFVQRVGSIDLGSVPYQTATVNGKAGFRTTVSTCIPDIKVPESSSDVLNMMSVPFYSEAYTIVFNRDRDNCCCVTNSDSLFLYASSLSALTASEFKTAMSGVYLYYELAEPVITDISEYLTDDHLIEVEAGGTLVFPNQHGDTFRVPVPSQETYMIDIQEAVSNG